MSTTQQAAGATQPSIHRPFAFDRSVQGVWDCDVRADKVHYSPTWKAMRGYDADEEVDSAFAAWLERVHPDDREDVLEEMRKQNTYEVKLNAFEYRERHKLGHYIWVLSLGTAIDWDSEGKPTRVIGTDTDITLRKTAELETLQLSRLLELAMDSSRDGVAILDLETMAVVQTNRAFGQLLQREVDEVVGMYPWDWDARTSKQDIVAFLQSAGSAYDGFATVFETLLRRRDGSLIEIEVNLSFFEAGAKRFAYSTIRDVTERNAVNAALRRSEAKFRAMFESTRRLIGLLEPDGKNIETNPVGYAFTGLDAKQVSELYFWEGHWWLDATDRARVREAVRSAAAGEYVQFEISQRSASGTVHTSDFSIAPIFGEDGTVIQLMAEATDITALKHAKTDLEQSERRWNYALESAGQGVWDCDIPNNQTYGSRMWNLMRGYEPDEVVDNSYDVWMARLHPDDRERIRDLIHKQGTDRREYNSYEYRERHKNGHYIWISSVGAAVEWGADGVATRRIGTDTNITERKLAEQKVVDLSRRLELALEASRFGVFELNLENGQILWDDRLREIVGLAEKRSPLSLTDIAKAIHPDDVTRALEAFDGTRTGQDFEAEWRFIRPDGEVRTMRSRGALITEEYARPRLMGVSWDVTEEVALTQSLQVAKDLSEARNLELELAKEQIEEQSLHDALTNLPNRRYLDRVLDQYASHSTIGEMALLHIDLDGFKQINDTLGHVAGDAMLIHVANLLRRCIDPEHFAARVGGDEFIVACFCDIDTDGLQALADRIIDAIRQPVPYHAHLCRFGASIGIAVEAARDFNAQRVLINADVALYQAKGRGRNRHEFFSEALQEEITSKKRIADDILRGIEQNEFIPHYQPLVDARTLEVAGVEALLRWNHPTDGMLAPYRFLKIAENLDVLRTIDHQVLRQAIRDLEQWRAAGVCVPSVSVNVTFQRLTDKNLLAGLRDLQFRPGTISFEFLESIFLDEFDDCIADNIAGLRDLGISVDVDDFGTGHTSIVSLLKLNPRRFKIDRQLVDPVVRGPEHRRLVASMVDIGKSLGIGVVAEGVETMEHARILTDLGCDFLQGYAFARPMPAEKIADWIRAGAWRQAS
jgi:diguanylate cyclase (GGDEF)-like protein/PAS domain S-box-containing protein